VITRVSKKTYKVRANITLWCSPLFGSGILVFYSCSCPQANDQERRNMIVEKQTQKNNVTLMKKEKK
jgi:hypothetical protein